jgi:formylglycine-generating enzyme required for sulfatase activity
VIAEQAERAKRLIAADFLDRAQETIDTILVLDPGHAMGKALAQRLSDLKRQQAETARVISMVETLIREHEYEKAVALLRSQSKLLSGRREYAQLLKTAEEGRTREAAVQSFLTIADQKEAQKKWLESFNILTQIRLAQPDDPRVEKRYQEIRRRVREWEQGQQRKTPEGMIFVPSGYFIMGDAGSEQRARAPRLPVFVDGFYIDRHPVTNRQYRAFLDYLEKTQDHSRCHPDEPRKKSHRPSTWGDPKWSGDDLPVVGINWFDAFAYAAWVGKRLPYETEWEKAASWKEDEETKLIYPWGNEFDPARCNCSEAGIGRPTPVDRYSRSPSPYGILDMCGNVWEWCIEWFYEYKYSKRLISNLKGPNYGETHILRGGAWDNDRNGVTTIHRSRAYPLSVFSTVGFRCCKSA